MSEEFKGYKKFHDTFLNNVKEEGFLHDDHIHPVFLLWMSFEDDEKKEEFLNFIRKNDPEYEEELREYMDYYDIKNNIIPVYFPFEVESEEEFKNLSSFLHDIAQISKVHAYSVLSEVAMDDDEEKTEEELEYLPSIFTEAPDGSCYMSVLDYKSGKQIDDYSGEYEKNDEYIASLRFPIFE